MALPVAAERRAREAGDAGLFEEQVGQLVGGIASFRDAGERVESALAA